jgi:polyisoprenoid-binding protein YceI
LIGTFRRAVPFLALLLAAAPAQAKPDKYVIDPEHFSIALSVRHIGYFDLVGLFTEGTGSKGQTACRLDFCVLSQSG